MTDAFKPCRWHLRPAIYCWPILAAVQDISSFLLAILDDSTKIIIVSLILWRNTYFLTLLPSQTSAYLVGLAASGLLDRFFLPCWCFGAYSWGSLAPSDGASTCDIDRVSVEVFDGPKGHTMLLQHPAQAVSLLN